jgi:hypothetical protein
MREAPLQYEVGHRISALGQAASGSIDVAEDYVRLEASR